MVSLKMFAFGLALLVGTSSVRMPLSDNELARESDVVLTGKLTDVTSFVDGSRRYFVGAIVVSDVMYGTPRSGDRIPLIWSTGWSWCFNDWSKMAGIDQLWCLSITDRTPSPGALIGIGARSLYSKLPAPWLALSHPHGLFQVTFSEGVQARSKSQEFKELVLRNPIRADIVGPVPYPIIRLTYRNAGSTPVEYPAIAADRDGITVSTGASIQVFERVGDTQQPVKPNPRAIRSGGISTFKLAPGDEQLIDLDVVGAFALKIGHPYVVKIQAHSDLTPVEEWIDIPDGVKSKGWREGYNQ